LEQAAVTGRYVAQRWPISAVYASPLQRTMQTAGRIAWAQGLQAIPFRGLLDLDFGAWQGLLLSEAEAQYPEVARAWYEAPHTVQFPGGESLDDVRQRVLSGLAELTAHHPEETIALISHNVVIRVLLCAVFGWGNERYWHLEQGNCAVNIFDVEGSTDYVIVQINDTGHLYAELK
jgi:probable phosphoglycerate mutase